jgi:hypothetical protein
LLSALAAEKPPLSLALGGDNLFTVNVVALLDLPRR